MNEKYLGLPVHLGKSKGEAFGYLKDRIWSRIQGWKEKFFILGWERDFNQGCSTSDPHFCYGVL
jgi:hypothetical protein